MYVHVHGWVWVQLVQCFGIRDFLPATHILLVKKYNPHQISMMILLSLSAHVYK